MKIVFVDTNVILDVLLQNENFWSDSLKIFQYAEKGMILAYVSASSMTDIFYIVRKKFTIPIARDAINRLLNIFEIASVDGIDLKKALAVPINDMEDALQAWCAEKINAEVLITRDIDDFSGIAIPIVTPTDFLP